MRVTAQHKRHAGRADTREQPSARTPARDGQAWLLYASMLRSLDASVGFDRVGLACTAWVSGGWQRRQQRAAESMGVLRSRPLQWRCMWQALGRVGGRTLRLIVVHAVLTGEGHDEAFEGGVAAEVVRAADAGLHLKDDGRKGGVEGLEVEAELGENGGEAVAPAVGGQRAQRAVEADQRINARAIA